MGKSQYTVALVTGGPYEEREISLQSAQLVSDSLTDSRLRVFTIDIQSDKWIDVSSGMSIDKNDFTLRLNDEIIHFDIAYLMLHGSPAEDGKLQGYFDMLGIPYTGCDVFVSALSFNKNASKNFVKAYGIHVAQSLIINENNRKNLPDEKIKKLGEPLFVKPNRAGSSYGVHKLNKNEPKAIKEALDDAFQYDSEVLIEEYLAGREFSCGVIPFHNKLKALPVTELIPEGEFFDYAAKYEGKSKEVTPADITQAQSDNCRNTSIRLYRILGCEGIVRFDYILCRGEFYFLEANTIPGLSPTSIVPQEIEAAGLSVRDVLQNILLEKLGI